MATRWWRRVGLPGLGLVACALAACGGSGGPIPLAELGPRIVEASCTAQARCGYFPDEASCAGAEVTSVAQIQADVSAGKAHYDPAAAGACLDAIAATSCDASGAAEMPPSCNDAIRGTLAENAACFSGVECLSGICDFAPTACADLACCAGTCAALAITVAENGDCSSSNAQCAAGTFCGMSASGKTCQRKGGLGTACTSGTCASGLTCVLAGPGVGSCGNFAGTGQGCADRPCDAVEDYCDSTTHLCTKRLPIDADCSNAGNGCARYAACSPTTSKCAAKSGAGGPCSDNEDCLGSLRCGTDGLCALPPATAACL